MSELRNEEEYNSFGRTNEIASLTATHLFKLYAQATHNEQAPLFAWEMLVYPFGKLVGAARAVSNGKNGIE